ncbi:MAG: type II toxin-antitoxin system PemK/MazF family toxin [bacterium]
MNPQEYLKDFDRWNIVKKELNHAQFSTPFNVREVWWASLGVNVGREEDGKHEKFERPVIVLKKYNKDKLLIAPLTGKEKDDRYIYKHLHEGVYRGIIFSQLRTISAQRLLRKMWRMDLNPFEKLLESIKSSF